MADFRHLQYTVVAAGASEGRSEIAHIKLVGFEEPIVNLGIGSGEQGSNIC